jgi:hypothetical protein
MVRCKYLSTEETVKVKVKIKISLLQAVEAHRVVRCQGSYIS